MSDRAENLLLALPGLLLLALAFFLPIGQMMLLSLSGPDGPTLEHFARFLGDSYYLGILWRTVRLSLIITAICAVIGFPLAYIMARVGPRLRMWLVIAVILPLMTSVVVRTFGWMVLLSRSGLVPELLRDMGLVGRSFGLMQTETAIVIGMVQVLLPFMTLSILGVVTRIEIRLEEAARTMGCSFLQTMRAVVLPLSLPGIVAGSLLVFTLSASSFVTPNLLGGARIQVLASSIYKSVTQSLEWPFAAAQAVILFVGILLVLVPYIRLSGARHG
ncbi:ABC transporter permease [Polymorphum gilvum]|uniref:AttA2-like ABC transporter, permease protein n=1 Tax=Polymorphum gilvum (strain LMG 25793 / CGMCC 1.9160 / SL003B-26A1) TaxID=991905 RepID=F2J400_POLGS|nr:ABC transporter permease [Polymorphum gilvum]ADZ68982.1 AttA2-like ABC transporter, permease protein [Polymorphum gilvum SL003B-26A1]